MVFFLPAPMLFQSFQSQWLMLLVCLCGDFSWIVIDKKVKVVTEEGSEGTGRTARALDALFKLFLPELFFFFLIKPCFLLFCFSEPQCGQRYPWCQSEPVRTSSPEHTHTHTHAELWLRTVLSRKFHRSCRISTAASLSARLYSCSSYCCPIPAPFSSQSALFMVMLPRKLKKRSLSPTQSTMTHWPGPEVDFCHCLSEVRKV